MIWVVAIVIAVALFFLLRSQSSSPSMRHTVRNPHSRSAPLPAEEQAGLASQVRETASENYGKIAAAARSAGKDEAFAHQVGVLQALTAVVSPGRQPMRMEHSDVQMETAPFNKLDPVEGRAAIIEYCVWKVFPDCAVEEAFAPALLRFRDKIQGDDQATDDEVFASLYNEKYDWQRWLADHRDEDHTQ